MPRQAETRPFQEGDRVIYAGEFIGTLAEKTTEAEHWDANGKTHGIVPYWRIEWEDGAVDTLDAPEPMLVYANGGPDSAQCNLPKPPARISPEWKALVEAAEKMGTAVAEFQNAKDAFVKQYPKGEQGG
jgi:hypothetical protein